MRSYILEVFGKGQPIKLCKHKFSNLILLKVTVVDFTKMFYRAKLYSYHFTPPIMEFEPLSDNKFALLYLRYYIELFLVIR